MGEFDWFNYGRQTPNYASLTGYGSGDASFFNANTPTATTLPEVGSGVTSYGGPAESYAPLSTPSTASSDWNFDWLTGGKRADGTTFNGMGNLALTGLSAGMNAWMGLKNLKLGRESLDHQKQQYAANFDAQRKMVNSQLEDRQRVRVLENPNAIPVAEYMAKYGIS